MAKFFFIFIIIYLFLTDINSQNNIIEDQNNLLNRNIIHFIKCGNGDSILIESNGKYGLIDAANNYEFIENEVESVQIDENKGEENQWTSISEKSVQSVLDYLESLNIKKLDFILGTHSHNDHIGGIPAIAFKYVDNSTIYYYKEYRENLEDIIMINWANKKYYLAALHSMKKKNAKLIEVSNKKIKFDFGNMNIELLNTEIPNNSHIIRENTNSIATLIKFKNTKVFLASDLKKREDRKIKNYLGKINILKLAHHGYSESSHEFLRKTRPDHVIISNDILFDHAKKLIKYMKNRFNPKIYITQFINDKAIKLHLDINDKDGFYFENQNEIEFIFKQSYNKLHLCILLLFVIIQIIVYLYRKKKKIIGLFENKNNNKKDYPSNLRIKNQIN